MMVVFLWRRSRLGNLERETVRVGLTNWDKKCQFKNTGVPPLQLWLTGNWF